MASKEAEATLSDFFHMNSGNGETSYASNSTLQESVIKKAQLIVKETIKSIAYVDGFPRCFNIADLGCSSGPNTLLVVSNIVDFVHEVCKEKNLEAPQVHVYLNDLFGNDFNSVFKALPVFYAKHNKETGENFGRCFISAVPGTFYGRLFPDQSIHFFHSSTSLHWLSQVPKGLENNKLNIYIAKTSPPDVFERYKMQFQKDFTMFLESRSKEVMRGGRMVLTFPSRSNVDPSSDDISILFELLSKSLVDMVKEGMVSDSDINSFNMPMYNPYKDEVKDLIEKQGSFSLDILESFKVDFNPCDANNASADISEELGNGKKVMKIVRAGTEPILVAYFGNSAMDSLFQKFGKYVDTYMSTEGTKLFSIVVSLTKI